MFLISKATLDISKDPYTDILSLQGINLEGLRIRHIDAKEQVQTISTASLSCMLKVLHMAAMHVPSIQMTAQMKA